MEWGGGGWGNGGRLRSSSSRLALYANARKGVSLIRVEERGERRETWLVGQLCQAVDQMTLEKGVHTLSSSTEYSSQH